MTQTREEHRNQNPGTRSQLRENQKPKVQKPQSQSKKRKKETTIQTYRKTNSKNESTNPTSMKLNYRKSKSKNGSTNPTSKGSQRDWTVATSYRFEKGLDWRWSCWRDIGFEGSGNTSDSPEPRWKAALYKAEG